MNRFRNIIIADLVLVASLTVLIYQAKSDLEVSAGVEVHAVSDFYDPLAATGVWLDVGRYGRCWHPRGVALDWRPYCEGHWVWTDCGWYWETDEPWGWACYHYGTWVVDPSAGWCWVPGIEWAPAWVEWREGGGYVGWAPCAPAGVVVAPTFFAFVDVNHFADPIRRSTVVMNDPAIIQRTTVLGTARRESREIGGRQQSVMVNQGPAVGVVEKATGRRLSQVSVQDAVRQAPPPANFRPSGNRPGGNQRPTPEPQVTPSSRNPGQPAVEPRTGPSENPAPERNTEPRTPIAIPPERPAAPPGETRPAAPTVPERPAVPGREEQPTAPTREERPASPPSKERPAAPGREERPVTPSREAPSVSPSREERPTSPATSPSERPASPSERPASPPREERPAAPPQNPPPGRGDERGKDQGKRTDQSGIEFMWVQRPVIGVAAI